MKNTKMSFVLFLLLLFILILTNSCQNTSSLDSTNDADNTNPSGSADENQTFSQPEIVIRQIDGTKNNENQPLLGSAETQFVRFASYDYADGFTSMSHELYPNAREVSNTISQQDELLGNSRELTSFVWQWGQFIDHDITLSETMDPLEAVYIPIPAGDPLFDPEGTGEIKMVFNRTEYDPATGFDTNNPREQMNSITSWIDASNVYGSTEERANWLRTFEDGKLKTSDGNLLPFNDGSQNNAPNNSTNLFVAGDVRANEQSALTAMHILFVREHNRLCDELKVEHPEWNDETLYQMARKYVGAYLQNITYSEFLPALLGEGVVNPYNGYDANENGAIRNEFATVLFRVGHTMVASSLQRLNNDGSVHPDGHLRLMNAFFNPSLVLADGIEPYLMGLAHQEMEEIDPLLVTDLRNFLFGPPGADGLDLAALNIQRGRDHGIPDYNTLREDYGLPRVENFEDITSDPEILDRLKTVYKDINSIDPFAGALAEDHLPGSSMGELLTTAWLEQFEALRDGDRFWFENDRTFSEEELQKIKDTKLSDIIRRNTNLSNIPENVFFLP